MHDQRDEFRPTPQVQRQRGRSFAWSLLMWACVFLAACSVLGLAVTLIAAFVFGFRG